MLNTRSSLLAAAAIAMAGASVPGQAGPEDFHFGAKPRRGRRKGANSTEGNREARGAHKAANRAAMKARRARRR